MAPSSLDLMSSPDPLHETIPSSAAPFTRRVTRSQRTQRFASLSNSSPRKQTFELDVGNEISPQKIVVTVEAESEHDTVSRRLFTSPTRPKSAARRREKTTTTKVPLKGMTDDEGASIAATPKRRGRPPRSGTPTPGARKRTGTPLQKTPRQSRRAKTASEESESEMSRTSSQAAPKSASRTRQTPAKKAPTSAKKADGAVAPDTLPKKRGRPRRLALAPEEAEALVTQDNFESTIVVSDVSLVSEEGPTQHTEPAPALAYHEDDDDEEDIWMANLSEPPTPVPQRRIPGTNSPSLSGSPRRAVSEDAFSDVAHPEAGDTENESAVDGDGRSDSGSYISENPLSGRRDLDTIAQGEDFSMIAFDSMQSYHANSSMREDQLPEMGETTSLIVSQTLESLRRPDGEEAETVGHDDGDDLDLDATPKASSSAHMASDTPYHHRPTSDGPLFSQQGSPQGWSRSPRRTRATPLSKQLALKTLQKDSPASRPPGGPTEAVPSLLPASAAPEDQSMYDDSFSEIPEAVLEAATPRRVWNRHQRHEEESESPAGGDEMHVEVESPLKSSVVSTALRSESSRMLTPDDTASPAERNNAVEDASQASDVTMAFAARSSPPQFGMSRRVDRENSSSHSRQSSAETPLPSALSPQLPPTPANRIDGYLNSLVFPPESFRPALSPIVRAGRALQSVTSDPPSPKDRESHLGSPFRGTQSPVGSNREASQPPKSPTPAAPQQPSSTRNENRTWSKAFAPFSQLKNLVVQGAQVFSPRANVSAAVEDPFALGEDKSHPEAVGQMDSSDEIEEAAFGATLNMSTQVGPPSDDGMDWEADPGPSYAVGGGASGSISSVFATGGSNDGRSLSVSLAGESDVPLDEEVEDDEDDFADEDIWAIEAQRPTPAVEKSKANEAAGLPPRRSKLPSPWRKNSKRLLYSDELANIESPGATDKLVSQASHADDYSMLSVQSVAVTKNMQEKVPPMNRLNLSDFFSSPANIPQIARPGDKSSALQEPRQAGNLNVNRSNVSLFSKATGEDLSARPPSRQGVPTASRGLFQPSTELPSVPQKGFLPSRQRRGDLFSPTKAPPAAPSQIAQDGTTSPSTPERPAFSHVAQKQNFTPRQGGGTGLLFGPVATMQAEVAQPQTQLSSDPLTEEEDATDASHLTDESSFAAPTLKPLPPKLASPSKSSFRSPLKPKTPGRVVEFTSSTLSPLAQMQARAAVASAANFADNIPVRGPNGLSSWGQGVLSASASTVPAPQPIQVHHQTVAVEMRLDAEEADKENEHSPVRLAAAQSKLSSTSLLGPMTLSTAQQQPPPAPRGPAWSRAHWKRLDELLQERRRDGALQFQLRHQRRGAGGAPPTPSRRPSAVLLGKQITSQGETMVLEQWHLDVVDAFGAEASGPAWAEKDLAKRVFSLLVGEERRRLGLVPTRR